MDNRKKNKTKFNRRTLTTQLLFAAFAIALEMLFFRNILWNDNLIGSCGDARYIDLILEHYWQWLNGSEKFSDLRCFYPVTNTISYSDMLLALAIPFCIFRALGASMFMANKLGLILMHTVGTFSTIYLLRRKMKLRGGAVVIGTIIFCYANSLSVKSWHNQMFAVCLIPLILIGLWTFFENIGKSRGKRAVGAVGAITVLALIFYTSFYNSYFFVIYAAFLTAVYLITLTAKNIAWFGAVKAFVKKNAAEVLAYVVYGIGIMIPFLLIYLPTLSTSGGWDWGPVHSMLPTWRDFFNVSPFNLVYGGFMNGSFFSIEGFYAGELRTGFPLVTFELFVIAAMWMYVKTARKKYTEKGKRAAVRTEMYVELMYFSAAAAVFCCFLCMIKLHGHSLWYFIYRFLPGASAIRAVSRFNMFLTLPVGIVSAVFADRIIPLIRLKKVQRAALVTVFCGWLVLENTLTVGVRSLWTIHEAVALTENAAPPPSDCKVMYIIDSGEEHMYDNDKDYQLAAWEIAYKFDLRCMNGHSGKFPEGWRRMSPHHKPQDYRESISSRVEKYALENVCAYDIYTNSWLSYETWIAQG